MSLLLASPRWVLIVVGCESRTHHVIVDVIDPSGRDESPRDTMLRYFRPLGATFVSTMSAMITAVFC